VLTQRFGSDMQTDPKFVDDFLAVIARNPGCCDEVWLASNYGFPPMDVHRQTVDSLIGVAEKLRAAGLRVSLQISNTIGHGQYMCSKDNSGLVYPGSPIEHMVGHDGTVAELCFCWNGEHFRAYVREEMREYARLHPHTVWVDDDLRATNHDPVHFGCFCADCIARFNAENHTDFDREGLVDAINKDIGWREKYVAFLRAGIGEFVELITREFCAVSPESGFGLQYCAHGGYTGYGYAHVFDAMRRGSGKAPKSRPGGGGYDDHDPRDQLWKAYFMMWQNSMLPEYVTEIRPEIENLPFYVYGKSPAGTCMETSLYLASGANAMSYSMLMHMEEPMAYHERIFAKFSAHRAYWEALAEANMGTQASGLCMSLSDSMWKRRLGAEERSFAWNWEPWDCRLSLVRVGIPHAYNRNAAEQIYLLHEAHAKCLSDAEIETLLARPVVTDGHALAVLAARGFGERLAATVAPLNTQPMYELLSEHTVCRGLQSGMIGGGLGMRSDNFRLICKDDCEILSYYQTVSRSVAPIGDSIYPHGVATAIVPTVYGAKWVVFGREPWRMNISTTMRDLVLRAAEYAAGQKRFSAILESWQQAVVFPRENSAMQTTSVSLLNCTIGDTETLTLRVRRPAGTSLSWMTAESAVEPLAVQSDGDELVVTVPALRPWTVGTLFLR